MQPFQLTDAIVLLLGATSQANLGHLVKTGSTGTLTKAGRARYRTIMRQHYDPSVEELRLALEVYLRLVAPQPSDFLANIKE
jgi:hypothetical protein